MSWLNKLESVLANDADKIPPGWFSINYESKRLKTPRKTIFNKVAQALKRGILTRQKFRVIVNGKFRRVYYYRESK